jgi:hypothetical protein
MMTFNMATSPGLMHILSGDNIAPAAQAASIATAKELEAEARPYPGPANHPVVWQSEAQRRYYFAMRRARGLPPNYTRQSDPARQGDPMSERMMMSWVVEPYETTGALLKNSATYAPYVIGDKQSVQHELTGWRKLSDVAREFFSSGKGAAIFEKAFSQAMEKRK